MNDVLKNGVIVTKDAAKEIIEGIKENKKSTIAVAVGSAIVGGLVVGAVVAIKNYINREFCFFDEDDIFDEELDGWADK